MSATLLLGNTAPLNNDGSPAAIGNTITVVSLREDILDDEVTLRALSTRNDEALNVIQGSLPEEDHRYAILIQEVNDLWSARHSNDPPEWVESDDPEVARVVADWFSASSRERFGDQARLLPLIAGNPVLGSVLRTWLATDGHTCTVGRPDGWTSAADVPPLGGGSCDWDEFLDAGHRVRAHRDLPDDMWARETIRELLTSVGRDALHSQHVGTGAQPAAFTQLALSASTATESAANTTLPGEITTTGGGLVRGVATFAHTVGTNTSTLSRTFTANASDTKPVTIAKIGIFNAASAGTIAYETNLSPTATLSATGDSLAVTWTLTAG